MVDLVIALLAESYTTYILMILVSMQIFLDQGYIKFLPASISQIAMSSTAYDVNSTSALEEEKL
jgi:hypothetical protein